MRFFSGGPNLRTTNYANPVGACGDEDPGLGFAAGPNLRTTTSLLDVPAWLETVLRVVAFVVGAFVVLTTFLSAVKTVVVPRAVTLRITRTVFLVTRTLFEYLASEKRPFAERDRILAVYAPLTLVLLPLVWVSLTIFGFAGIQWAIAGGSIRDACLVSGSSMLTLGVLFRRTVPAATFSYVQASIGLILVAEENRCGRSRRRRQRHGNSRETNRIRQDCAHPGRRWPVRTR